MRLLMRRLPPDDPLDANAGFSSGPNGLVL